MKLSAPEVEYSDNMVIISGYANGMSVSHSARVEMDLHEGLLIPVIRDHLLIDGEAVNFEDLETFLMHGSLKAQAV